MQNIKAPGAGIHDQGCLWNRPSGFPIYYATAYLHEPTKNSTTYQCDLMGCFHCTFLWDAPVATLSTKCHADIIRCYMAIKTNPKRRFELVLEEAAAFAAASNEQWQIYAQQQMWHLENNPLYHGHADGRIIMIRASQGHSGA